MIAYAETYVSGAQVRLGTMTDAAVNLFGCELGAFYDRFLESPLAARFSAGDPAIVAGRSGEELALEVLDDRACASAVHPGWPSRSGATAEYWSGWALAFYQWASGFTLGAIQERVAITQVLSMYRPYHEMDVRQFCDKMDELCERAQPRTNLQERRLAAGISQSQLARASGIPKRTLQQYEQRQKDINHARADYVQALAKALCCSSSDLLEHRATADAAYAVVRF